MTSTEEDFLDLARHANPKGGTGEDLERMLRKRQETTAKLDEASLEAMTKRMYTKTEHED